MPDEPTVSAIVRAKNKASTIERALASLRRQVGAVEIIVVDSGSTDGTVAIARTYADVVVQIPPEEFTYGGALNRGAAVASGDIHVALSAHCELPHERWVSNVLRYYRRSDVAATNGIAFGPAGNWLSDVHYQSLRDVVTNPAWGFSNHAASWRSSVWNSLRFREDLDACEDKEWSWRVLAAGMTIAYANDLVVDSSHRRELGVRALYERVHREAAVLAGLDAIRMTGWPQVLRTWWSSFPVPSGKPNILRRLSPYRAIEIIATEIGARTARPLRDPLPELLADVAVNRPDLMNESPRSSAPGW